MKRAIIIIRAFIGDLLLLLSTYMLMFTLLILYDQLFDIPHIDTSISALLRNSSIFIVSYILGSFTGYSNFHPFSGKYPNKRIEFRQFLHDNCNITLITKLIGIAATILFLYALIGVMIVVFFWNSNGDINNIDIISQVVTLDIPSLLFGYKWFRDIGYLNNIMLADREDRNKMYSDKEIKEIPDRYERFRVISPTLFNKLLFISVGLIFLYVSFSFVQFSILFVILEIISFIVTLLVWIKISPWIVKTIIIRPMISEHKKSGKNILKSIFYKLIGLRFDYHNTYYIEGKTFDIDGNQPIGVMKDRILSTITSSLSIVFLLIIPYTDKYLLSNQDDAFMVFTYLVFLIILSPIIAGFIVPVFWFVKDINIRCIDHRQVSEDAIIGIEKGILNRFIGYGGVLAGIDFITKLFVKFPSLSFTNGVWPNPFLLLFDGAIVLVLITIVAIGGIYMIIFYYIFWHHERLVNRLRNEMGTSLPICQTLALKVNDKLP